MFGLMTTVPLDWAMAGVIARSYPTTRREIAAQPSRKSFLMDGSSDEDPILLPRRALRRAIRELELRSQSAVRLVLGGAAADDLERELVAVDVNDHEMMLVLRCDAGFRQVLDADGLARPGGDVGTQIGLAGVAVLRRSAAARDQTVKAVRRATLRVPLDEVIEQMIVSGEDQPDVVPSEERHVHRPQRDRLRLGTIGRLHAGPRHRI